MTSDEHTGGMREELRAHVHHASAGRRHDERRTPGVRAGSERAEAGVRRLALVLFAVLSPAVALAQSPEPGAGGGAANASNDADASDDAEARAREHFRRGVGLARAGDCPGAITEFEASYALVPRPNTLYNLAQCEERLHRYDRAIARYEEYLRVAPPDAEDRAAAEETLASLRELLGTVRIESNVPAEVWVEDRIVGQAPGDVLVPGGRRAIELRAQGYLPARREIDVVARSTVSLRIELERAEQRIEQRIEQRVEQRITVERPPLPPEVFVTGVALTAASLLAGTIAGGIALAEHDRISRMDPRLPRDGQSVRDAAIAADVAFIAGGVLLASTVIAAFLTDWGGPAPTAGAWLGPGSAGVVLGGEL